LELVPEYEVSLIVEHKQVRECIKKDVEVFEFGAPWLSEVDQSERARFFDKYVHLFFILILMIYCSN